MNREGKKCVLYSRVGTEMQVDGFSLEGQITRMKTFADREEMIIVNKYEDAGKSVSPYPDDLRFRQCFRILKAECKLTTYWFTNFPVSAEMRRIY